MEFLLGKSIWVYCLIFIGKILEVALATSRMVLINRGERAQGSIIAFFEISLWLLITGTVVIGLMDDILKVIVFALAFSVGNYFGSWLEDKLAFGLSTIEVISSATECVDNMLQALRANNFAVTVVDGEGRDGKRKILLLHLKRKRIAHALKLINEMENECFITVTDVKVISGGYIKK